MTFLDGFNAFALLYFVLLNGSQLLTAGFSIAALRRHASRSRLLHVLDDYVARGGAPAITLLVPAHNEEPTCVEAVKSLLTLEYGDYEILVINDGSTDDTLGELARAFDLVPANRFPLATLPTARVRATLRSARHPRLWVLDKENGGKADALNAGLNHCRTPLFCAMDADCVLERDALKRIVRPFIENDTTVAAGGLVRIANGCVFKGGVLTDVRMPDRWLARFQVLEYLRAFLTGRMGWDAMSALLIISGAFGLFRRSVVIEAGGFARDTVGEDMELIVRLHRFCREKKRPYRITFVPDPVAWTECPERLSGLARQRDRWQRGLVDSLLRHIRMLGNPGYGAPGLIAFPYYFFLEMLGPVVELFGYVAFVAALIGGRVSAAYVAAFALLAFGFGMALSIAAVSLEEQSFHRFRRTRDYMHLFVLAFLENFGYRQLVTYWRLHGLLTSLFRVKGWGAMKRLGVLHRPAKIAAGLTLLSLFLAGAPARGAYWQFSNSYERQSYGPPRNAWYTTTWVMERKVRRGSLTVEGLRYRRFGRTDRGGAAEGYLALWPKAYANARFQAVVKAEVVPRVEGHGEIFQSFGKQWEASFRYRHMDFRLDDVDIYAVSLAKYAGRWYARTRFSWIPQTTGAGYAREIALRRYGARTDDFFELTLSRSSSNAVNTVAVGVTGDQTTSLAARAQKFWNPRFGTALIYLVEDEIGLPPRRGLSGTLFWRWGTAEHVVPLTTKESAPPPD
ncbi:MAG: glycosyltransferase [Elusimicrobia bacterium]|nr:glycosyltransferase [Elusimicrobiota bacterium]